MEANNMAAMRDALNAALDLIFDMQNADRSPISNQAYAVRRKIKAALTAPPRNCDVGTAEGQEKRFAKFCDSHKCVDGSTVCSPRCPLYKTPECSLHWAQMPYEEGGSE